LFFGIGISFYFFVGGAIMLTGILFATIPRKTSIPAAEDDLSIASYSIET
jgi:hypothetical protein